MTVSDFQSISTNKRVDTMSQSTRSELERRYPDMHVSRALDCAIERLKTLEQLLELPHTSKEEKRNV